MGKANYTNESKGINITPNYINKLIGYDSLIDGLKHNLSNILKNDSSLSKFIKNHYGVHIGLGEVKSNIKDYLVKMAI